MAQGDGAFDRVVGGGGLVGIHRIAIGIAVQPHQWQAEAIQTCVKTSWQRSMKTQAQRIGVMRSDRFHEAAGVPPGRVG